MLVVVAFEADIVTPADRLAVQSIEVALATAPTAGVTKVEKLYGTPPTMLPLQATLDIGGA